LRLLRWRERFAAGLDGSTVRGGLRLKRPNSSEAVSRGRGRLTLPDSGGSGLFVCVLQRSGQTSVMAVLLSLVVLVSGLHGVVTRGPITPVCKVGVRCSEPAVGAVLVFLRAGHAVARVRTGVGGRYSIRLAPGLYTVRLSPTPRIGFGVRPTVVRVARGSYRRLDFLIDTGIR